jgi:hypothetical protein
MKSDVPIKLASLYDTDYQLWLTETVEQLRRRNFSNLDLANLIEEIESLGKSDKRAISSYLIRLCEHLLKIKYWESERGRCLNGWIAEINNFRSEIELILRDSPSLRPFLVDMFLPCYQKAKRNMLRTTQLPANVIPQEPIFTLVQALDEDWLPWRPQ